MGVCDSMVVKEGLIGEFLEKGRGGAIIILHALY